MDSILDSIPPAKAMGIGIADWDGCRISLKAPLEKNLNDKGTAFAGSTASILSLAGWAAITLALRDAAIAADVMIVQSEISYTAAGRAGLYAEATADPEAMERVIRELNVRRRSRISMQARLHSGGIDCASMNAHYAVII